MHGRVIMHTPEPGSGAALYVADLVKGLLGAGEKVVLFCPRNFAYIAKLEQEGARVVCAGNRGTERRGRVARVLRNLRFLAESFVSQLLLTKPQDIIHFQFPLYFPAGLAFFVLAKLQAHAIVYTAHDPLPHKWLLPQRFRFIEKGCLHCAYSLSDRIIVHNPRARDLLVREFEQYPSKIAVIPHGCSERQCVETLKNTSGTLALLTFGSIREDKGIDLAIEAVQSINANGIEVTLLIAGVVANAREQEYWEACKRKIARASLGIRVVEKFVPDEEIGALLAACHAVLLPYKDVESDSGVAAVAMASGCPIIATNRGSFAPLLKGADLGIPIDSPCASSVEQAVRAAIALGPEELRAKGLRGIAFARATRSWDAIGRQTADLYEKMQRLPIRTVREPKHG